MTNPDCTPMKRCKKCGIDFPATTEYFHRSGRDGLYTYCKTCTIESSRAYYAANKARHAETVKAWRDANPERRAEADKAWREANKARRAETNKAWNEAHPERMAEASRAYKAAHPDKVRTDNNRRRALVHRAGGTHTIADIRAQLKRQKGRCYWCGEKVTEYEVDHVIPLLHGGSNGPENLVIACPDCNRKKGTRLPHEWNGGGGRMF